MNVDFSKISSVEIDGIDMRDYPDFCDAFMTYAEYDGKEMTDEMIEYINDNHYDFVYEHIIDNQLYIF